jgi:hypothetical protein
LYVSIWAMAWDGGPWPEHNLPLDALFVLGLGALGLWRYRAWIAAAPLGLALGHMALKARLVPEPRSMVEWGGAAIGLGFLLLFVSLGTSYWLRSRRT